MPPNDYPDFTNISGISALLTALTAAVNGLTAGFGASATISFQAGTLVTLGGPVLVLPAVAGKTHYLVSAVLSWWSLAGAELRGYVRFGLSVDNAATYFNAVLTPERPSIALSFGSGVPASGPNLPMYVLSAGFAGVPNTTDTQLAVSFVYYDK